jgi:hypothetical protein
LSSRFSVPALQDCLALRMSGKLLREITHFNNNIFGVSKNVLTFAAETFSCSLNK